MVRTARMCVLAAAMTASGAFPAFGEVEVETRGVVDAVTVYRGQALVTRLVDIQAPVGLHEILVTDLPEHVVPASLYAEGEGAEVRSVRYRVRPVEQDVREEVRAIDARIAEVNAKLAAAQRRAQLYTDYNGYLAKLEGFVAPSANVEMSKGVLNAEMLKTLSKFLYAERQQLMEDSLERDAEEQALREQLDVLGRERGQIASGSSKNVREAVLFVNIRAAQGGKVRLKYLVNNASWSPSYTIRADEAMEGVGVEYYAAVEQMSGEDWTGVHMTLSTATPMLVSAAPELDPMSVTLTAAMLGQAGDQQQQEYKDYALAKKEIASRQRELEVFRNVQSPQAQTAGRGQRDQSKAADFDKNLNALACDDQLLDLIAGQQIRRGGSVEEADGGAEPEQVAVAYELSERTSLPSRSDVQQIQIASVPMDGEFYKLAMPVLTSYVYDEALVSNGSGRVLLAGPVSTYVGGRFVGSGALPTVAAGETFKVGFGIDTSLRASRELVEKTDSYQGGNRIVNLTYRLEVENFGSEPALVRLLDRVPKVDEREIKLTLTGGAESLCADAAYQQIRKEGILRWDIEVPAQASALAAKAQEYGFKLEYDKQMSIGGALAGK